MINPLVASALLTVAVTSTLLAGCAQQPATVDPGVVQTAIAQTAGAIPTYTPYPTYTLAPTQTPLVILVTPTSSPTPLYTPTETLIPTETPVPTETFTPTPTVDLLYADHDPGIYLVNIDIAPGVWRSLGSGEDCYWQRSDKTGEIIDNYMGFAGGTIYIAPSDFSVELDTECGNWTYFSPP